MNAIWTLLVVLFLFPATSRSQETVAIPKATQVNTASELFPNASYKSIMTPTAWGSTGTYLFGSLGATYPRPYLDALDLEAGGGLLFGNAYKLVSAAAILNMHDVSKGQNYSWSLLLSRRITKGTFISTGALNLFSDTTKTDAGSSFYVVISHTAQTTHSRAAMISRFSYSIGAGNGRFYQQSRRDIRMGKAQHGTIVFANLSYELFKNFNVNTEWSGVNLTAAIAYRPSYKFPAVSVGVTDLTRYSGDKPRFVVSIGQAIKLKD